MVQSDKEVKQWFKKEASKEPTKYYATNVLEAKGFQRKQCACGTFFWTVNKEQAHCGDASCAGGFTLFKNNPCTKAMTYIETWQAFAKMFDKKGYAVVPRYPVVARWNQTMEYTIASIAAFQPYVVSGEVEAPAKKLVIPQFCLRFGDVDNVGVTMSHMTGFIMIGQHAFVSKEEWNQDEVFQDILDWLTDGLGLPLKEITFHEDAWAGGGNFGPCMEYFSRGVELGNQVYMMYEQDDDAPNGYKELQLKVLDMGMGHERNAWFSQGKGTIYDATFPTVIKKLLQATKASYDEALVEEYTPYAAFLNLDEVENVDEAWARVSKEVGWSVEELKERIGPLTAIYSIAEHARALLFALADGALPSNVGGGYNLRMIYRRAQSFIDEYEWSDKVDLGEVARWHAEYLKPLFPELLTNLKDVQKILAVEQKKYYENKKRAAHIIEQTLNKGTKITTETLVSLYDTQGVQPSQLVKAGDALGVEVKVPENFFTLVSEKHEHGEHAAQTRKETKLPLDDVGKTSILYFDAYDYTDFEAPVEKVLDDDKVVLERTAFYPTSGGQLHDTGTLDGVAVKDVVKQDGVIVHVLGEKVDWRPGKMVTGKIDIDRRLQLTQHHTAAHIINGAARKVLGNHVWQAGAAKTLEKGRLDITHYEALSDDELLAIEREANKIVRENIPVHKDVEAKNLAEAAHGFRLYQGGAVPGKEIRVVNIPGYDVEACGGTHVHTTGETGPIKLLKSTKVQDGVVRIEFTAGKAAVAKSAEAKGLTSEVMQFLGVDDERLVPAAAERLFTVWKRVRKAVKKGKGVDVKALLNAKLESFTGDALVEAAKRLQTQPEHLRKTLERFKNDVEELQGRVKK